MFGYIGSQIGISRDYLLFGAGLYKQAKIYSAEKSLTWQEAFSEGHWDVFSKAINTVLDDIKRFGNDEEDYEMIIWGIEEYYADTK